VSVSWSLRDLQEEYIPWFDQREWKDSKIKNWFKDKHSRNKNLIVSSNDLMWLKRRLWLANVQNRKQAKVPRCDRVAILPESTC